MKAPFVLLLAAVAAVSLTSCPETKVPRDFGLKPVALKPADWEGDWASAGSPQETVHFSILKGEMGLFNAIEPSKEGKKSTSTEVLVYHQSADKDSRLFFLTTFEKPGDATGSVNLVSKQDSSVFYFWGPDHEAIEKAIESGRLKGTVTKDKDGAHCMLAADKDNYKALGSPEFWDWTKPQAFFKNGKEKAHK